MNFPNPPAGTRPGNPSAPPSRRRRRDGPRASSRLVPIILALGATLLALLHVVGILEIPFVRPIEQVAYDSRVLVTARHGVDPRIVIVDIDEKSLAEEGQWPWRRDRLAQLLDRLFDVYDATVVGFDVVFAERDASGHAGASDDGDALLARKLAKRPVVLGYYFTANTDPNKIRTSGTLPDPQFGDSAFENVSIAFARYNGYGANLAELQANAAGGGYFTPIVDSDGAVRRVPMLAYYDHGYYEPLSLAVARTYLKVPRVRPVLPEQATTGHYRAIESLLVGGREIPVDRNVAALVPYRGPAGSFPYLSATDVLKNRLPAGALKGKIVLVGTTAPGLQDLHATPVGTQYPGVEVHANMIAGILDQNIKHQPAYVLAIEFLAVALIGLILGLGLPSLGPVKASLLGLGTLSATALGNLAAWQYGNLLIPLVPSLLLIAVIFLINMSHGFFVEARAKHRIAGLFGQYVPPELVEELNRRPELCSMEGESRELTVLFCDLCDFIRIAESMPPPELARLLNFYLSAMTEVIQKHRGTIDKYIGDATMAFWGAPLPDADHAAHALEAALEMQARLKDRASLAGAGHWPPLRMGIGINTGTMVVGNMGSQFRRAYTVVGDAVNLAARIEGLTREYGVGIIVGESVVARLPQFAFRELDRVTVKGKETPVSIYEPVGRTEELKPAQARELARFAEVLRHYREQRWDEAAEILDALLVEAPDSTLYRLYAERIRCFRANPSSAGRDGVFAFRTK